MPLYRLKPVEFPASSNPVFSFTISNVKGIEKRLNQ
jgi:hypothetical protein